MTFRDSAIAATEDIIDALGTPGCQYDPLGPNNAVDVTAVVDFGTFSVETEDGMYIGYQARLEAKASDMPTAEEGDVFRYNGGTVDTPVFTDYTLFAPENDGMGKVSAWLTLAS